MGEKVTIPREVAEAIDALRNLGLNNYAIGKCAYGIIPLRIRQNMDRHGGYYNRIVAYCDQLAGKGDNFLSALVNGYEVERTPHEKLRDYYNGLSDLADKYADYGYTRMQTAVRHALDYLGITVEGITDEHDGGERE